MEDSLETVTEGSDQAEDLLDEGDDERAALVKYEGVGHRISAGV